MGSLIKARTSGTSGPRKMIEIGDAAISARCEALRLHMERVGQAVACNFSADTTIKVITATEAVKHGGGNAQEWPGDETTTLLVTNYSPILKALRDYPDTWKTLKEIWFAHIFIQKHADRIEDMLNVPVRNYYGTTETGCIAIDGVPLDGVEIEMHDDVLHVRCGGVVQGLANADGWFRTGDTCRIENGRIVGVARAK
jgi:hypothetical protein